MKNKIMLYAALIMTTMIVVFLLPSFGNTAKAANINTPDEAINWVKKKEGTTVGAGQCVSLVAEYIRQLGGQPPSVDYAKEYSTCSVPSGFTRISKADGSPQKGDILIWTGNNGMGHVGIYESDYSTWHQNDGGAMYVKKLTYYYTLEDYDSKLVYWGVMRPTSFIQEVEWATVTANNSSVPIGKQVNFSVSSNVGQGENGYYYDLYIWDQASYASGGSGTWVGVSANSASYTFNTEGDYYVRFRVHNTAHDLYSDPLIIHVYGQSVSLRITSGTTGSANIVNAGGQVGFEFVTGYTQGQDGCYFDMYVWDYQSYLKGTDGIWVGVVGGKSSYVFNSAGIYFVRARIHNDTMNVYSEPLIIRVPTILQEDFYALILNRACWMPISQVEGSTGIVLKREDQSSKMVWRFQLQNNSAYSNSTYSISSCYDGKMLEMHNGTRKAGTQLTAHDTYWGGAYQQWYLFPIGDGFILQSAHYGGEGWVMDLRNNNTTDGNAIQINSMNGTTAQIWAIYRGNEVQLSGPRLQVVPGNSLTGTTFTWSKSYGATKYNLRIFKDKLYEGQDFSQWSVNSGCTTVLPAGKYLAYVDAVNYHLYKAGATVEFTIPEAYAVSFNLCGGSGAFDTLYKEKGQILLIPENQPTREGFNFIEWNTKADGSGESFHPGDGYIADAGLILYAQWVEQTILYLPAGLKTIESGAFEGISAAIVYVPEGCISIGSRAFANCANLKYIFVSNLSAIDIADDALEGTNAVFIEQ